MRSLKEDRKGTTMDVNRKGILGAIACNKTEETRVETGEEHTMQQRNIVLPWLPLEEMLTNRLRRENVKFSTKICGSSIVGIAGISCAMNAF